MADIFPVMPESSAEDINAPVAVENIGISFVYDHESNNFIMVDGSPKECNQAEAVMEWIAMWLRLNRNSCKVFEDTNLGISKDELIGSRTMPAGFARSELIREIQEMLLLCPAIASSYNYVFTRQKRTMQIAFTVSLHTGETLEVVENV